jgi:hypothetical protein
VALLTLACQPDVRVRRVEAPVQTTLSALGALYAPDTVIACRLPAIAPGAAGARVSSPDEGVQVTLPGAWRTRPAKGPWPEEPEVVFDGPHGSRVAIMEVVNGASGPLFLMRGTTIAATERPTCEERAGEAGAIWRFYERTAADGTVPSSQYLGFGEIITRAGKRYRVTVRAESAQQRDSIARRVSDAVTG